MDACSVNYEFWLNEFCKTENKAEAAATACLLCCQRELTRASTKGCVS